MSVVQLGQKERQKGTSEGGDTMDKSMIEKYAGSIRQSQATHVACVLLLDTSDSMNYPTQNPSIDRLNEAVQDFVAQAGADKVSGNTIDVAIVEFNSTVNVISDFEAITQLKVPKLYASGCTCMGKALLKAEELAKRRTREYQLLGTDAWIPWIIMFTDGEPTDEMEKAIKMLKEEEAKGKYGHMQLWIIATEGANLQTCKALTRRVIQMKDHDYGTIFDWTRESLALMSVSRPGQLKMPDVPVNAQVVPDDWMR